MTRYRQSGEINFTVADPDAVLAAFAEAGPGFAPTLIEDLDGISLQGEDWWVNLRKSNTEPLVRLNVEAPDDVRMRELTARATEVVQGRVA